MDFEIAPLAEVSTEANPPYTIFVLCAVAQLCAVLMLFWYVAPHAFRSEMSHPALIAFWILLVGLPLSLFEFLYHRYLLHSAVLPFMSIMQRAHGNHHGLTNVKAPVRAAQPATFAEVTSEFPIEESHQEESMMFPLYSGLIFELIFVVLLAFPLKWALPGQPVIAATMASVILYYSAYELWHAVLHLPFEKCWQPLLKNRVIQRVYGFHLMHHWRPSANQAIVGFWGFAIWDHAFGTHHRPNRMPLDKAQVTYADYGLGKPRWPISALDKFQGPCSRASRKIEKYLARVFLKA